MREMSCYTLATDYLEFKFLWQILSNILNALLVKYKKLERVISRL
jgi:hypothetical protein